MSLCVIELRIYSLAEGLLISLHRPGVPVTSCNLSFSRRGGRLFGPDIFPTQETMDFYGELGPWESPLWVMDSALADSTNSEEDITVICAKWAVPVG